MPFFCHYKPFQVILRRINFVDIELTTARDFEVLALFVLAVPFDPHDFQEITRSMIGQLVIVTKTKCPNQMKSIPLHHQGNKQKCQHGQA